NANAKPMSMDAASSSYDALRSAIFVPVPVMSFQAYVPVCQLQLQPVVPSPSGSPSSVFVSQSLSSESQTSKWPAWMRLSPSLQSQAAPTLSPSASSCEELARPTQLSTQSIASSLSLTTTE